MLIVSEMESNRLTLGDGPLCLSVVLGQMVHFSWYVGIHVSWLLPFPIYDFIDSEIYEVEQNTIHVIFNFFCMWDL